MDLYDRKESGRPVRANKESEEKEKNGRVKRCSCSLFRVSAAQANLKTKAKVGMECVGSMYVGQLWTVSTNLFLILCLRESEKRGLDHKERGMPQGERQHR